MLDTKKLLRIFRVATVTAAHFLLAGVYLFTIFGFKTDFHGIGNAEWYWQLAFWTLYAIYLAFTFPLVILVYAFPGFPGVLGHNAVPIWLLLQLGISYIQVRTIGNVSLLGDSIGISNFRKTR